MRSPVGTTSSSIVRLAAPLFGSSGSMMRRNVARTSAGVTGRPSQNRTPLRNVAVHVIASSDEVSDSASSISSL